MKIDSLKEMMEIIEIKEKVEKIFRENFTDHEAKILIAMMEQADELFWDIIAGALDQTIT